MKKHYSIDAEAFTKRIVNFADSLGHGLSQEHEKKLADEIGKALDESHSPVVSTETKKKKD
jgi:hypothetical protein